METAMQTAAIIGPTILVAGLSILIYSEQWSKIIKNWEKEHLAFLELALINLLLGGYILSLKIGWLGGPASIINLIGWISLFKGVFYFLAPSSWIKETIKGFKNPQIIALSGLLAITLGAYLSYYGFLA